MSFKIISLLLLITIFFFSTPKISAEVCGVFYKKIGDKCVKFEVPANAHLTYSGNSWECNRGFKLSTDQTYCEEIKIPTNAMPNLIGSFYCNSGFKRVGNECQKVPEIANGKFYEFGADFFCQKGFRKNEAERKCEKIKIPENAKEDSSSLEGWRCFGGYIKEGSDCKKFVLPEHAFWSGDFWKCEQGFKKNFHNNTCEKVSIPENAKVAATFDDWVCNQGYTKNYRENRCDK